MDKPFTTDGCSMFPDGDWGGCCVEHDKHYWRGGDRQERLAADILLSVCVWKKTDSIVLAFLMFLGVRIGGMPYLPTPWRWGYGWKYKKSFLYRQQEKLSRD